MKKTLFLILLFIISIYSSAQEDSIKLKKYQDAISKQILKIDSIAQILSIPDSGFIIENKREGLWNIYRVDTSQEIKVNDVKIDNEMHKIYQDSKILKETGYYKNNKREGLWRIFWSFDPEIESGWKLWKENYYKLGLKDSVEKSYMFNNNDVSLSLEIFYKNGKDIGLMKTYNIHKTPSQLIAVYERVNDDTIKPTLEYYESGKIKINMTDTIIRSKKRRVYNEYFESGKLKQKGVTNENLQSEGEWRSYYENGGLEFIVHYKKDNLHGNYKYFYPNGKLWTEQIFIDGKLINILSNFNQYGKQNYIGTFKDGNGVVIIYDEEGKIDEERIYKDGMQIK